MSGKQVEHIVFIKLIEEPTEEFFAIARGHLTKIKQEIPGILYLSFGKNFTDRSQGFNAALVVRFANKEALEVYAPHPLHVDFVNYIKPLRTDLIAIDFEIDEI